MSTGAVAAGTPGAPGVLLIHGLGGSTGVWDRVVPLVESAASVVMARLGSSASIERDADEVAAFMDGPTVVVGHSRGGLVATAIAERRPELVRKLILLCPPWSRASRVSPTRSVERLLAAPGLGDLLWASASEARFRSALRNAFAPGTPVPDHFVSTLRSWGRGSFVRSSRAIDAYLNDGSLVDRLLRLTVPTELLFGQQDARVAAPQGQFARRPGVRVAVLPGVGHTPPWEAPGRVADLIKTSLA